MSRKRRPLSEKDKRLFAAGILLILGRLSFAVGVAAFAMFIWLGIPKTTSPTRLILGIAVGAVFCMMGFRWASGTWKGSLQPLVQSYALAGIIFLGIILKLNLLSAHRAFPPVWLLLLVESPLLWLLITRRKSRRSTSEETSVR